MTYEAAAGMLSRQPDLFRETVQASLRRQVAAINTLSDAGMYFFDYGNAFLLEARRSGAPVEQPGHSGNK